MTRQQPRRHWLQRFEANDVPCGPINDYAAVEDRGVGHEQQQPEVPGLTLRRTYSSWAHEKGAPAKVGAQMMGHAKVDATGRLAQLLDYTPVRLLEIAVRGST